MIHSRKQQKCIEMVSMVSPAASTRKTRTQHDDDKEDKNCGNIFNGNGNLPDNLISEYFSTKKNIVTFNQQFQGQAGDAGWVVNSSTKRRNKKW